MLFDLSHRDSLVRVSRQEPFNQVFAFWTDHILRNSVLSIHDLLVKHTCFRIFKGQVPTDHGIKDHTTTPDISVQPLVFLACDHLRSCVTGTSASCFEELVRFVSVTEAEVYYLYVVVVVHQEVFRLQIAMADAKFMKVLDT